MMKQGREKLTDYAISVVIGAALIWVWGIAYGQQDLDLYFGPNEVTMNCPDMPVCPDPEPGDPNEPDLPPPDPDVPMPPDPEPQPEPDPPPHYDGGVGLTYSRVDRAWQTWDGVELGCEFDDPLVPDPETGRRCWRGWDLYNKLPETASAMFGFAANADAMYMSPEGVEHVLYECEDGVGNQPCSAYDTMPNWEGSRIYFAVYEGKTTQRSQNAWSHPDAPSKPEGRHPQTRILCTSHRPGGGACGAVPPVWKPDGAVNGAVIYSVDVSDPENPGEPVQLTARVDGEYNTSPVEVCEREPCTDENRRVLFFSTRQNHYEASLFHSRPSEHTLELHSMKLDGSDVKYIGQQHAQGSGLHMFQCPDGYVYYSFKTTQGFSMHTGANSSNPRATGTENNHYRVARMFPDGSNWEAPFGIHQNKGTPSIKGLHFGGCVNSDATVEGVPAQPLIAYSNYYRANNNGLGDLLIYPSQPQGVEGQHAAFGSGQIGNHGSEFGKTKHIYWPLGGFTWPEWGTSTDGPAIQKLDENGVARFTGKFRTPAAYVNGEFIFTYGKGGCSTNSYPKHYFSVDDGLAYMKREESMCHMFIGKAAVPSLYTRDTDPTPEGIEDDPIVRDERFHYVDARAVLHGDTLHNTKLPILETPTNDDGECTFTTRNARLVEATAKKFYAPNANYSMTGDENYSAWKPFNIKEWAGVINGGRELFSMLQDRKTVNGMRESHGIQRMKFYKVTARDKSQDFRGHRGEAYRAGGGNARVYLGSADIETDDGSFSVELPCDTAFMHAGATSDDVIINSEDIPMAIREGEDRQCRGCHLHSAELNPRAPKWEEPGNEFIDNGLERVKLTDPGHRPLQYNADILPLLDAKCGSCHSADSDPVIAPVFDIPGMGCNVDRPDAECSRKYTDIGIGATKVSSHYQVCWDFSQQSVPDHQKVATGHQKGQYFLDFPWGSRWVNLVYPAESPLLWAAHNRRLDGRTNDMIAGDFDYYPRPEHDGLMEPGELEMLRDYIFTGCFDNELDLNPTGTIYPYLDGPVDPPVDPNEPTEPPVEPPVDPNEPTEPPVEPPVDEMPDGYEMVDPTLIYDQNGDCGSWDDARNGTHTGKCKYEFTMRTEKAGYYEPLKGEGFTEWPVHVLVPPRQAEPYGIQIKYHGGSGTKPDGSNNSGGNNIGLRLTDTKGQSSPFECTGYKYFQSKWLGYGFFGDIESGEGQIAQKYTQRRIAAAIFWTKEQFGDHVTFNSVKGNGSSMGHQGGHSLALSYGEPWSGLITEINGTVGGWNARDRHANDPNMTDGQCRHGRNIGANAEYWRSIDTFWHIENNAEYRTGHCGVHGWGGTDNSTPHMLPIAIEYQNAEMCVIMFRSAGGHMDGTSRHNTTDGCFRWPSIYNSAMGFTRDHPIIAFSNSTGNKPLKWNPMMTRGHYNFGLEWDSADIVETEGELTMPVRYYAKSFRTRDPLLYGETEESCKFVNGEQTVMPPQPDNITVDVTLQRPTRVPTRHPNFVGRFWPEPGQAVTMTWEGTTYTATAGDDGRVKFSGIPMTNKRAYSPMVFSR